MSIVIVSFGLLGLAALQGRATNAELESYQRGQALILLQDMVNRIENNPAHIEKYITADKPAGMDAAKADCRNLPSRAETDLCEWGKLLRDTSGSSNNHALGEMIDARGCIEATGSEREYRVSVVWQGLGNTTAPTGTNCGEGLYESEESRRAVTSIIVIPDLAGL